MDTFTFLIALVFLILAFQYGATWLSFAVVTILILTMRSLSATVLIIVSSVIIWALSKSPDPTPYWPYVIFGLIILALLMGQGEASAQPEYFPPAGMDPFGGMGGMGGMGGLGGAGGEGY